MCAVLMPLLLFANTHTHTVTGLQTTLRSTEEAMEKLMREEGGRVDQYVCAMRFPMGADLKDFSSAQESGEESSRGLRAGIRSQETRSLEPHCKDFRFLT